MHNALAACTADLDQARADLKAAGSRAETGRDKAHQEAEAARAETCRVRTDLTGQLTELRAELAGQAQAVRQARAAAAITEARLHDQHDLQQGLERAAQQALQRLLAERTTTHKPSSSS